MQAVVIILRLVHIVAGAFWAGSGLMLALFIFPAARRGGPEGAGTMRTIGRAQVSRAMSIASLLTTVSGLLLYGWASNFRLGWITSHLGLGLTAGALAGLAAFLLGQLSTGPTAHRLGALSAQMGAAGGPPSPEQVAEMGRLQAKLAVSSTWSTILTTLALALMAVARYL